MKFSSNCTHLMRIGYGEFFEEVKNDIDEMGFIDKQTMADLMGESGMEFPDDKWIMDLEGWDYMNLILAKKYLDQSIYEEK